MAEASIGLADAVKALRAELNVAIKRAAGEAVRFEMGEVEMEFLVAIEKTEGADAGIRFWVVSIGAHADHRGSSAIVSCFTSRRRSMGGLLRSPTRSYISRRGRPT